MLFLIILIGQKNSIHKILLILFAKTKVFMELYELEIFIMIEMSIDTNHPINSISG